MPNLKLLFFSLYLLTFFGCATAPRQGSQAVFNLHGVSYYPLTKLCDSKRINLQYDTFSRAATLTRDAHRINLRAGETLILVDGKPVHLASPVEIHQGMVVVPLKFKEQVLDTLFKEAYAAKKAAPAILSVRKVVIDAGHGGSDPGTIGRTGLREKDVNLDIARRLCNILQAQGIEVIMTRSSDKFIPLSRRAEIANSNRADLFISVHSNANRVRSLNGFEVYYVAPGVSDTKRAYTSAVNSKLNFDSSCFAASSLDLRATLWDMIYTCSRAESIELSRSLLRSMDENLDARCIGIKSARFEVLRGVQMPAVLIEVGFLSNRNEELMLKNGFYRQKVAESIASGIRDYAQCRLSMEASTK